MIFVFALTYTGCKQAWMSGAPGSLVYVILVSIVENYSVEIPLKCTC